MLILAIVFFTGTFGLNFQMTSALMATEVFDKGATEYGLLGTFMAVGSLTGSLLAARRPVRPAAAGGRRGARLRRGRDRRRPDAVVPHLRADDARCSASRALTMITAANAFMQLHTDAGMRGRVMALYMMIFIGGTPLGAPLIGWVGEEFGARWTLILGGLAHGARRRALASAVVRARQARFDPRRATE